MLAQVLCTLSPKKASCPQVLQLWNSNEVEERDPISMD